MSKALSVAVWGALVLGQVGAVQAMDLSLDVGQTGESSMTYRLAAQFDFNRLWLNSSVGHVSGFWDVAYTYWKGDDRASNNSLSFSPVFVYEFHGETIKPYIEAGIGVAAFSGTRVESRKLGSSFQFEDRLGLGIRFYGQELGLRAFHYSNAGIQQPNDGVESYTLHYRTSF